MIALSLLGGVALSGCAYGFGDPYGGYGGVNVGYSSGYGYGYGDPYGYGYGSPYGYANYGSYGSPYGYGGYGSPYGYGGYGAPYGYGYDPFGWYGNSYYPGTGIYVYDRQHRRRSWSDAERNYWQRRAMTRRQGTAVTTTVAPRENWSGFDRSRVRTPAGPATTQSSSRDRWQRRSPTTTDTATTAQPSSDSRRGRRHDRTSGE